MISYVQVLGIRKTAGIVAVVALIALWPTVWSVLGGVLAILAIATSWLEQYNDLLAGQRRIRMKSILAEVAHDEDRSFTRHAA